MADRDDGGPAFPRPQAETSQGGNFEQDGMSLREWFAGQALVGLLSNFKSGQPETWYDAPADRGRTAPNNRAFVNYDNASAWAIAAYVFADAMIAHRSKEKTP